MNKKRKVGLFVTAIIIIILYLVLGALLPFAKTKNCKESFKKSFNKSRFYGDGKKSADRAAIIETSQEALDIRLKMIEEAKEEIVLATFDIRNGKSSKDIFSCLWAAADRGVNVKILVDGMYGMLNMSNVDIFEVVGSHQNVEIKFYNPPNLIKPWTINGRHHDKYMIVDQKFVLGGGRNIFDYFLGEYNLDNLSFDRDILIYNTEYLEVDKNTEGAVAQVRNYFNQVWEFPICKTVLNGKEDRAKNETKKVIMDLENHYNNLKNINRQLFDEDTDYINKTVPVEKITFITNPVTQYGKEPHVWYQLNELIKSANERVILHTPYAVADKEMLEGINVAVENGIQVDMLLNSTAVGDNFMASSDYTIHRKDLLNTGANIYEFHGERSSHGKSYLIDNDISLVGSYNFDMRSTYVNTETLFVVHGEEFNKMLYENITDMKNQSLKVLENGEYEENSNIVPVKNPIWKQILFAISSILFQLIRYLI